MQGTHSALPHELQHAHFIAFVRADRRPHGAITSARFALRRRPDVMPLLSGTTDHACAIGSSLACPLPSVPAGARIIQRLPDRRLPRAIMASPTTAKHRPVVPMVLLSRNGNSVASKKRNAKDTKSAVVPREATTTPELK